MCVVSVYIFAIVAVILLSCMQVTAFAPMHTAIRIIDAPTTCRSINNNCKYHKNEKSIQTILLDDTTQHRHKSHKVVLLASDNSDEEEEKDTKKSINDQIFWAKQKALAAQMTSKVESGVKQERADKFAERRMALTSDTFYFSILIGTALWIIFPNPFVTISYLFGALLGTAYSYGLGKYVETIGGSIDDVDIEGAGVGQARFAFLILLVVVVGKFRSQGLLEIPSITGFFTYQLASLGQGLREIDD